MTNVILSDINLVVTLLVKWITSRVYSFYMNFSFLCAYGTLQTDHLSNMLKVMIWYLSSSDLITQFAKVLIILTPGRSGYIKHKLSFTAVFIMILFLKQKTECGILSVQNITTIKQTWIKHMVAEQHYY